MGAKKILYNGNYLIESIGVPVGQHTSGSDTCGFLARDAISRLPKEASKYSNVRITAEWMASLHLAYIADRFNTEIIAVSSYNSWARTDKDGWGKKIDVPEQTVNVQELEYALRHCDRLNGGLRISQLNNVLTTLRAAITACMNAEDKAPHPVNPRDLFSFQKGYAPDKDYTDDFFRALESVGGIEQITLWFQPLPPLPIPKKRESYPKLKP
jgi:hypothetical protein